MSHYTACSRDSQWLSVFVPRTVSQLEPDGPFVTFTLWKVICASNFAISPVTQWQHFNKMHLFYYDRDKNMLHAPFSVMSLSSEQISIWLSEHNIYRHGSMHLGCTMLCHALTCSNKTSPRMTTSALRQRHNMQCVKAECSTERPHSQQGATNQSSLDWLYHVKTTILQSKSTSQSNNLF